MDFTAGPWHHDPFHFGQSLHAALHCGSFGGFITEAFNETHFLFNPDFLSPGSCLACFHVLLSGKNKVIIAAVIQNHVILLNGNYLPGYPVEKSPVMGGHHNRSLVRFQIVLEPDAGLKVQVIGRLIQQQHIRIDNQEFSQSNPHQPSSAELIQGALEVLFFKTQSGKNNFCFMFDIISTGGLVFMLQIPQFTHQLGSFFLITTLGQGFLQDPETVLQTSNPGRSMSNMLQQLFAAFGCDFLSGIADSYVLAFGNAARIRNDITGNNFKKGGLAGSVGTDNGDAVPGTYIEGHSAEKDLYPI